MVERGKQARMVLGAHGGKSVDRVGCGLKAAGESRTADEGMDHDMVMLEEDDLHDEEVDRCMGDLASLGRRRTGHRVDE